VERTLMAYTVLLTMVPLLIDTPTHSPVATLFYGLDTGLLVAVIA